MLVEWMVGVTGKVTACRKGEGEKKVSQDYKRDSVFAKANFYHLSGLKVTLKI